MYFVIMNVHVAIVNDNFNARVVQFASNGWQVLLGVLDYFAIDVD